MMYEMITSKFSKKFWGILLSLLLAIGMGGYLLNSTNAYAVDVGTNPTPKVDIAVNVPSDYPGTFLDFKQELTEKLIKEGMTPGSFRITDTAVKIDTTNLNGWYVYDHYYSEADYNKLVAVEDQAKQPKRLANDSSQSATYKDLEKDYYNNAGLQPRPNAVYNFNHHIRSFQNDGKANMAFVGYATPGYMDYMIYPAASDSRRQVSFDLEAAAIDLHTIFGGGFLLNAGIDSRNHLVGYLLYLVPNSNGTSATASVRKIDVSATEEFKGSNDPLPGKTTQIASGNISLGNQKKARISVDLQKDKVTIQSQEYQANGSLADQITTFNNGAIVLKDSEGRTSEFNGFGPMVNYKDHGCSAISSFLFTDLEMSYAATAFDALKTTQFYEGADQKYFINLAGTNNDPQIPKEYENEGSTTPNEGYRDGIKRMNENEIFYISNAQDGQIVTNSEGDHQGLGANNGYIAMSGDPVGEIAKYIVNNQGNSFRQAQITSDIPLANFFIVDAATKASEKPTQIMTVHLRHLLNQNGTVSVNIRDKSKPGTLAGENGRIAEYKFTVYDKDNNILNAPTWLSSVNEIPDYTFTKDSPSGRYTFELVVRDQNGNESKASQTYVTAFMDDEHPYIEGENSAKNVVKITLTDKGDGIDEDGITFIEDDCGSGVAAYWVTNDTTATPKDSDWITEEDDPELVGAPHQKVLNYEIEDTKPIVVWVKDECGNIGNKAVFQPTRVVVQDPEGNTVDEYYVIGDVVIDDPTNPDKKPEDKPIIVLPDPDGGDIPSETDDGEFSGWVSGNDPIVPGSKPGVPEDNTVIIRPSYSKDKAKIVYVANGGKIDAVGDGTILKDLSDPYEVVSGSSIEKKLDTHNVKISREGYKFVGWKLLDSGASTNALNSSYINDQNHLLSIEGAVATQEKDQNGGVVRDVYYLVAQWEIGKYTLTLDPNGGNISQSINKIADIAYNTSFDASNIGSKIIVDGRQLPTRNGYVFKGWSESADNDQAKMFKSTSGFVAGKIPVMPAEDKIVYAVWEKDTSKFVVSFDSDGGSRVNDVAYLKNDNSVTNYKLFTEPTKTGYTFDGWYLKKDDDSIDFNTRYHGTETFWKKEDHTFVAKWIPSENTSYSVEYYVNKGSDADGKSIYERVSNYTQKAQGTTGTTVAVPEDKKLQEIVDSEGNFYWFNPENSNNVITGEVTGSPELALKLYYDRYFDVVAETVNGSTNKGTVTGAAKQKEGTNPTVSWTPANGYKVSKVIVDGNVRDDLLNSTSYTFTEETGIHENHSVKVEFVTTKSDSEDPSNPPVNPPSDNPVDPIKRDTFYKIQTLVNGCPDNTLYEITPSHSIKQGESSKVSWSVDSPYEVESVLVDDLPLSEDKDFIEFNGVQSNHKVVVNLKTVSDLPSIGGGTDPEQEQFTITVNKYGATDGKEVISKSQTVSLNGKASFSSDMTNSDYQIYKILLDGEELKISSSAAQSTFTYSKSPLNKVNSNHVVDVFFAKKTTDGTDPVAPTFDPEKDVKVTTQLIGASGEITGGAVVPANTPYEVNWSVKEPGVSEDKIKAEKDEATGETRYIWTQNEPGDPNYACYKVNKITVNGEEVSINSVDDAKSVDLGRINEDKDVKVYVSPMLQQVTVLKYGEGEVAPSKTVFYKGDYPDIFCEPGSGYSTTRVVIDGTLMYEYTASTDNQAGTQSEERAIEIPTDNNANDQQKADEGTQIEAGAFENNEPDAAEGTVSDNGTDAGTSDTDLATEDVQAAEISNEAKGDDAEALTQSLEELFDSESAYALEDEFKWDTFDPKSKQTFKNFKSITNNHVVEVYFTKNAEDGTPTPAPVENGLYKVNVNITGGPATVTAGNAIVDKGANSTVSWRITDTNAYEVESVTVNGVTLDKDQYARNSFTLGNIGENKNVVVNLKRKSVDNDTSYGPTFKPTLWTVVTHITGGAGSIEGAGEVLSGANRQVSWTPGEGEVVKYVYINGVSHPELVEVNAADLNNITSDQTVVVVVGKPGQPPINVDTDGDDDPDINKDTDGDGRPDVDVDTDGDGKPDVNKDTDGDGKPDVNIVDKDGKPGPDNINPEDPEYKPEDGKPNINVDTDGDDKPDLFIDVDGDYDPDANIDTDKDGYPDVNIDTDGDGKPDVNIDTDNTGTWKPSSEGGNKDGIWKPDTNIDTGDGQGPIHTDYTDPIDYDHDGVHDLWKPQHDTNAENGFAYDTMKENWTKDNQPGEQPGSDDPNGDNNDNPADNSKDKNDKSKKSKSSKTGDMTAPIAGGIALIALLSGLVLVLARRRKEN